MAAVVDVVPLPLVADALPLLPVSVVLAAPEDVPLPAVVLPTGPGGGPEKVEVDVSGPPDARVEVASPEEELLAFGLPALRSEASASSAFCKAFVMLFVTSALSADVVPAVVAVGVVLAVPFEGVLPLADGLPLRSENNDCRSAASLDPISANVPEAPACVEVALPVSSASSLLSDAPVAVVLPDAPVAERLLAPAACRSENNVLLDRIDDAPPVTVLALADPLPEEVAEPLFVEDVADPAEPDAPLWPACAARSAAICAAISL